MKIKIYVLLWILFASFSFGQYAKPSIDQIFERWDKNKDGLLSKNEIPDFLWKNISYADKDQNGSVSKQELQKFRTRAQGNIGMNKEKSFSDKRINQENIQQLLKRFDRNHDNALGKEEVPSSLWEKISKLDFNKDDLISEEEFRRINAFLKKEKDSQRKASEKDGPFQNIQNWSAFDAGAIQGLQTQGYFGATYDGRYIYYAPCRAQDFHGYALRYDTQKDFHSKDSWESYDAGQTDGLETKGYSGAVFDGRYVYYVPFAVLTQRHARILRYDTHADFRAQSSWKAYDAQNILGRKMTGYVEAVFDGRYIFFSPFGYDPYAHALVLRYDTQGDFQDSSSWSFYNAQNTQGLATQGFYGAIQAGDYIYFVPFHDGENFHGRVLRYNRMKSFALSSAWEAYDAGKTGDMTTIGYKGAAFDGTYIYFVPFRDQNESHGRVLRYDTSKSFHSSASWSAFDAGNTDGLITHGYVGAIYDKQYVYFVPYSEGTQDFHAHFLRYNSQKDFCNSSSWESFDGSSIQGLTTKGYKYAAYDGTYIYFVPYHNGISFSGIGLRYKKE